MSLSTLQNGTSSLQSPGSGGDGGGIATAKYPNFTQVCLENHHATSSSDTISCSSLSPIASISASSPTSSISATPQSLFQQGLLLDPRSPALLLQPTLTAVSPVASHLTEEDMDDSGPFVCYWENCNQEFPLLESLVVHLDRGHTLSMDKYVCLWKDCARNRKPFDARYKLITHLRCHTGEKPYKCEYPTCTRSFSRLENLKLHVRTHTGEKPYECHYEGCTKKFNNTSDRAKHMKTHITRKPYICKYPGCGKSYTDPSSMRKHIKYTHKLKERQGEVGQDRGHGFSNGPLSHHSSRKRDSHGSSTSPNTPKTPASRFIHPHPTIPRAVTFGHPAVSINGQLIQTLPSPPLPSSALGNSTSPIGAAPAAFSTDQLQQPQLIPVPLVHLSGAPSSVAQSLSFLPGLAQGSPLLSQGTATAVSQQQQQQVVMLLPSTGVASAGRDIVALSPQNAVAKLQSQQPLPPIQVLQQASTNGRVEVKAAKSSKNAACNSQYEEVVRLTAPGASTLAVTNEEEHLRLQIAQLQQQLLQSQQAQLLAQQQVAQLQLKQHHRLQDGALVEMNGEHNRQTSPPISASSSSPTKLSPSKVTIVTSGWPCNPSVSAPTAPIIKSQTSQSSSPPPGSRKASGQILLTRSVPILSPTGQTVLPTQLPVMLGQARPQVIPIVQSQGVPQPQILYMTPSTS